MARSPISFGDYVITQRIARGGMAEIYRARRVGSLNPDAAQIAEGPLARNWVALKMMRSELENHQLREKLFKREAIIAQAIRHPNVVPIYEFGFELKRHFLAMEYVLGKNLNQLPSAEVSVPIPLCIYIAAEAAKGLGYAHRLENAHGTPMDIVHRDVSPGNIMVGFDGTVKILDFGVARMNETNGVHTQTGTLRGKFAYMSPEQTLGSGVDARSDVFSFGVVLYELLTGKNPFRSSNPIATLDRVQRHRPVPPSQVLSQIPSEIDELLARCLAKDPRRRFADGIEIYRALKKFAARYSAVNKAAMAAFMEERFGKDRKSQELALNREFVQAQALEVIDFPVQGELSPTDTEKFQSVDVGSLLSSPHVISGKGLLTPKEDAFDTTARHQALAVVPESSIKQDFSRDTVVDFGEDEVADTEHIPGFVSPKPVRAKMPITTVFPARRNRRIVGLTAAFVSALCLHFAFGGSFNTEKTPIDGMARGPEEALRVMPVTMLEPITINIPTADRVRSTKRTVRQKTLFKGPQKRQEISSAVGSRSLRSPIQRKQVRVASQSSKVFGFLNVGAKPWGEILIDGVLYPDITPQTGIKLTTGIHTLTVRNPETGIKKSLRVDIEKARFKTVMFNLRRVD